MKIMVKIPILSIFYYDIVIELHVCTKQGRPRLTAVAIKKYTMALLNRNALIQRFLTGSCMLRSLWYPSPQGLRCGPERVEEALMASAHDECQGLGLAATRLGRRAFFVRSSTGRFKELAPNERTVRVNAGMAVSRALGRQHQRARGLAPRRYPARSAQGSSTCGLTHLILLLV